MQLGKGKDATERPTEAKSTGQRNKRAREMAVRGATLLHGVAKPEKHISILIAICLHERPRA